MRSLLHKLYNRMCLRPCHGCSDSTFHTAHLTRLGERRWVRS